MSKPVVLRIAADRDLDSIVAFLHKESRQAAERFADAIGTVVQLIGDHPGIGSTRHAELCPELPQRLRFYPVIDFPRILVYYIDRPDVVEVIRIWDAARGLEALLQDLKGGSARESPATYRVTAKRRISGPAALPPISRGASDKSPAPTATPDGA